MKLLIVFFSELRTSLKDLMGLYYLFIKITFGSSKWNIKNYRTSFFHSFTLNYGRTPVINTKTICQKSKMEDFLIACLSRIIIFASGMTIDTTRTTVSLHPHFPRASIIPYNYLTFQFCSDFRKQFNEFKYPPILLF